MTKEIKAILFDLDGTIIDTNELIIDSFLKILNDYFPGRFEREDVLPFMGPPLIDTFTELNPGKGQEMTDAYRAYNKKMHDKLVREFPNVNKTIALLAEKGYKLAVVTAKQRDVALEGLRLFDLEKYFEIVVAFDDVENSKPHPESLFKVLEALDANPEEAIMIGDNYHDIVSGQNAGTLTAGVAWSLKGREFLEQYKPDYMLEKIEDLFPIIGYKG